MMVVMQPTPSDPHTTVLQKCREGLEVWMAIGLFALVGGLLTTLVLIAGRSSEKVQA